MIDSRHEPRWVDAVLDWRWTGFIARALLVSAYLLGGVTKLLDFSSAAAEQEHFGLHPGAPWAALTIAVEVIAPVLIIWNRWVWIAAGTLGVFTIVAACIANPFWAMHPGQERFMATNAFFEHLGLVGGFVLAALAAEHAQREGQR